MMHAQIVSPPMPTGVSWLLNCLLALGIRTTDHHGHWQETPAGSQPAPEWVRNYLRTFLPILQQQAVFRFEAELELFWSHRLSYSHYPARKTILCVRDLRDSAYSQFRREVHEGRFQDSEAEWLNYLATPEIHSQFFPPLFDLPPADTLALFYLLCLQLVPAGQLLILRFEDVKAQPEAQLRRVLDFLGLERDAAALARALELSSRERAQELTASLPERSGHHKLTSRAGLAYEWKTRCSDAALAAFAGPAAEALATLGYEPLPEQIASEPPPPEAEQQREALGLLEQVHRFTAQGHAPAAQQALEQAFRRAAVNPLQRDLLAGQLLAILWTRAILGPARSHLPTAGQMARFFSRFNARYAAWPPLARAARQVLNPAHALHSLGPASLFASPGGGEKLIYHNPRLGPEDFGQAVAEAGVSGLKFLLWRPPGLKLESTGLLQLADLLNARLEALGVLPWLEPEQGPDFSLRALARQRAWGAEFARVRPTATPVCGLFRVRALAERYGPSAGWLASEILYQALGVLAEAAGNRPG